MNKLTSNIPIFYKNNFFELTSIDFSIQFLNNSYFPVNTGYSEIQILFNLTFIKLIDFILEHLLITNGHVINRPRDLMLLWTMLELNELLPPLEPDSTYGVQF